AQLENMHRPSGSGSHLDFFQQQRDHANHELSQKEVREKHAGEPGQEFSAPDYKAVSFQQQQARQSQQQQNQQLQHTPSKQSLHSQSGAPHPPRSDSHQPPNSASSIQATQQALPEQNGNPHAAFLQHLQNSSLSPSNQTITSTSVIAPD